MGLDMGEGLNLKEDATFHNFSLFENTIIFFTFLLWNHALTSNFKAQHGGRICPPSYWTSEDGLWPPMEKAIMMVMLPCQEMEG